MNTQKQILDHIDTAYSYQLAKQMEQFRSNPVLGYRPSGSVAEYETGEMLLREMTAIGLQQVHKDAIKADGWEFQRAVLTCTDADGTSHQIQLGAYQTEFITDGPTAFSLVYLGRGTEEDYQNRDVTGKLVLADINQRDEWWINYPVYQAHLKGASALIAVQDGGYGEFDEEALNAQDIAGPSSAPAFSISRKDAALLKSLLAEQGGEISVTLDAFSRIMPDCTTYNIVGMIPGIHPDRMIMLSAHYDSYFSGFQDDNTAVAMMLGIAKALTDSGYRPHNTLVFCAMAAEEWGVIDSVFDWSTGAYEQVFTAHPEWVGKVIADLNFELPALAHGTRARIRSCYEYTSYLKEFLSDLPVLTRAYPEDPAVTAPIETWSDDFSIAISGIPSMVNDFTGGSFMETHYHSQFDNDSFYDERVYRLHHELFALLVHALDQTAVVPLCFSPLFERLANGIAELQSYIRQQGVHPELENSLATASALLSSAVEKAEHDYVHIRECNQLYLDHLRNGRSREAEELFVQTRGLERGALQSFKKEQDTFVRIDWYGNVFCAHEILGQNIRLLEGCIRNLEEHNISSALRKLYQVDNNAYAFMFDREVYHHFTDSMLHQPKERLKWGYQRLAGHEDLYDLVKSLLQKEASGSEADCSPEIAELMKVCDRQYRLLSENIEQICQVLRDYFI